MADLPNEPVTRQEEYLSRLAGENTTLPRKPVTREEMYLEGAIEHVEALEEEIAEMKANPDVADIVATHAELEAYDTSKLTDKDVIRVLVDETQNDHSTYYRWSTSTHEFTLIGDAGDYYTEAETDALLALKADKATTYTKTETDTLLSAKANTTDVNTALDLKADKATTYTKTEVDTALSGKQNTLTAGANITIANDVISATGGGSSYVAGDGIDITNDTISATNTGKAKALTAADYNWHSSGSVDNKIALWLLEPGLYSVSSDIAGSVYRYANDTTGNAQGDFLISRPYDNEVVVYDLARSAYGNAHAMKFVNVSKTTGSYFHSAYTVLSDNDISDNLTTSSTSKVLSAKQGKVLNDKLVAFTGTDGQAAGTAGFVPAPATTDAGKFLKADGTWDTAGGGSGVTVVQAPGTSTTDVMSQNATTSMIFSDPADRKRITLGGGINGSDNSIVIGLGARGGERSSNDVVIGWGAYAWNGNQNVVLGSQAQTGSNSSYSMALGANSRVLDAASHAIALGDYSYSTMKGQVDISTLKTTNTYGYNNSQYRLLTGLYAPQSAHDAANKEYVDPTTDSSAPTTATVGRLGQVLIDTSTATAYMCVEVDTTTDPSNPSYTWKQITA